MATALIPRNWWNPVYGNIDYFDDLDDLMSVPRMEAGNGLSISEDDKNVYVEAALPGINPEDIEVTFDHGSLWIRGETKAEDKDKKRKYYRRAAKTFSYRVALPDNVDLNAEPNVSYENGMIRIVCAKSARHQPRKLTVKVGGKNSK